MEYDYSTLFQQFQGGGYLLIHRHSGMVTVQEYKVESLSAVGHVVQRAAGNELDQ